MRESATACSGSEHGSAASTSSSSSSNSAEVVVVSSVSNGRGASRDDGSKPEPSCSSNQQRGHFRNHLQSGLIDSPLLQALSSSSPPPLASSSAPSTSTPLLKASLNSPPVAHNRVPTSAAATSSSTSSAAPSPPSSSSNGSVDLSMATGRKRRSDASPPSSSAEKQARPASELYANLIMQLRQQNQPGIVSNGSNVKTPPSVSVSCTSSSSSSSSSSRKERLKCQPSFQCPVCKKRFQRHIAMNAHFQNEHISGTADEKVCKLCSSKAGSISAVRAHLLREHQIDLERPNSFLVEPQSSSSSMSSESAPASPAAPVPDKPRIVQPATVTLHLTSNGSSSPAQTNNNNNTSAKHPKFRGMHELSDSGSRSSTASPAAAVPAVSIEAYPVKKPEVTITAEDVISEHARDLSMRRVSMAPLVQKKKTEPTTPTTPAPTTPQWQCQHCNIVFPNQTLYFLHRGFHSDSNPWRCNGCGYACQDMFDFNTHLVSEAHG